MPDFKDSKFLDAEDVAAMLRCDVSTVESKLRDGIIPGVKIGRSWVVPKPALVEEMSAQARATSAELRARRSRTAVDPVADAASGRREAASNSSLNEYDTARRPGRRRVV